MVQAPPLNLRLYDNRKFGRKPLVGVASVPNVREFMVQPGGVRFSKKQTFCRCR